MGNTFVAGFRAFFFPNKKYDRLVGMWESRVLGEISKSLWEPFLGFHRDGISTAVFAAAVIEHGCEGATPLVGSPIVHPGACYAVGLIG
jgi:hypothetical protein